METRTNFLIAGLLCAILAVFIAPAVFGVLGVAAGMMRIVNNARWRGALVVAELHWRGRWQHEDKHENYSHNVD